MPKGRGKSNKVQDSGAANAPELLLEQTTHKASGSRKKPLTTNDADRQLESELEQEEDSVTREQKKFEIALRRRQLQDLKRFYRVSPEQAKSEMHSRVAAILTMMLAKAYEGSAPHAKLCLEWAGSKEQQTGVIRKSLAEMMLKQLGHEVPKEVEDGAAESAATR